jgi:IPT/TIG domain
MKNITIILSGLLSCLILLGLPSCKKTNQGGAPPTISLVRVLAKSDTVNVTVPGRVDANGTVIDTTFPATRLLAFDSTITVGHLNNQYGIVGTNLATADSVILNGMSIYIQPALVTNTLIIITVPTNAPYGPNQVNTLVVVTKYGRTSFIFSIQQPPPVISSFTPLAGSVGGTVTITGSIFDGLTSVKFDTVAAQIVSSTPTSITVTIPPGIPSTSNIFVTTAAGGTVKSTSQFSLIAYLAVVYTDALAPGWTFDDYGGAVTTNGTTQPEAGTNALTNVYGGGYSAFRLEYNGGPFGAGPWLDVAGLGLTTFKFSIYGGPGSGTQIAISFNNDYGHQVQKSFVLGSYTDFEIPLSAFGNPTNISQIVIQEFSGVANGTIYLDDMGFN